MSGNIICGARDSCSYQALGIGLDESCVAEGRPEYVMRDSVGKLNTALVE
jgi:hypothetical protein